VESGTSRHNPAVGMMPDRHATADRNSRAGFHTWRTLDRFVRKGEKGIAILAPILRHRREDTEEDVSRVIVGFRTAYVFDGLSRDSDRENRPACR
jgi:antirestriction factor ArdC-like protein